MCGVVCRVGVGLNPRAAVGGLGGCWVGPGAASFFYNTISNGEIIIFLLDGAHSRGPASALIEDRYQINIFQDFLGIWSKSNSSRSE